jgi:hypothetical protein
MATFKYLGMTVINQTYMHEEIKSKLNLVNACYHSLCSILPSHLQTKIMKIKNTQN